MISRVRGALARATSLFGFVHLEHWVRCAYKRVGRLERLRPGLELTCYDAAGRDRSPCGRVLFPGRHLVLFGTDERTTHCGRERATFSWLPRLWRIAAGGVLLTAGSLVCEWRPLVLSMASHQSRDAFSALAGARGSGYFAPRACITRPRRWRRY